MAERRARRLYRRDVFAVVQRLEAELMNNETGALLTMNSAPTEGETAQAKSPAAVSVRDLFTIGEIAREFGFTLRALRFYEEKGLISPRRNGNRRLYSLEDRKRLEIIANCKKVGMPLEDIHSILQAKNSSDDTSMVRVALEKAIARLDVLEEEKTRIERHTREALSLIDGLNKQLTDRIASSV
jgi:DNA-binding transcriptional MerR regulator